MRRCARGLIVIVSVMELLVVRKVLPKLQGLSCDVSVCAGEWKQAVCAKGSVVPFKKITV